MRRHRISVWLSSEEFQKIDALSLKVMETKSSLLRKAGLALWAKYVAGKSEKLTLRIALTEDEKDILSQLANTLGALGRVGNNINQLARIANTTGKIRHEKNLDASLDELHALQKELRNLWQSINA